LKKTLIIITLGCLLCAVLFCVWLADDVSRFTTTTGNLYTGDIRITIPTHQPLKTTADMLFRSGVIRSPLYFYGYARLSGYGQRIQAGEYQLSGIMTPKQILEILASGKVYHYKITIPEGFNLNEIAATIAREGLMDEHGFLETARNPGLSHTLNIDADTVEGYLFPDTYYFTKGTDAERIISTMTRRFRQSLTPAMIEQAGKEGLTIHQAVTLASLIEKETGADNERPIVSSVFHNRLKRKMRLESDPTVVYGIDHFDGKITRQQLATPTPYNTYMCEGLPFGPIASPGLKSILAAIYPAQTDYLYFVATNDKTHQFSRTLDEHLKAVRRYQRKSG